MKVWGLWLVETLHPPIGRGVRKLLGIVFVIMGLARLGLFSYGGGGEFFKPTLYGGLFVASGVWLLVTSRWPLSALARLGAVVGSALCAGMATDLVMHGGSTTSAANLVVFAWCLVGAAGGTHDD
jgi:hypothetical protein